MCLVLGSNDVGMSTIVRTLCGRLNDNDELFGTILLNGMPMGKSNQGWRRLTSYVSASDTTHSAVLTVQETITFAAQCTSDGNNSNTSASDIQAKVTELLEILGLDHVADTVVGDENLRGVSGGQKVGWNAVLKVLPGGVFAHLLLTASSYRRRNVDRSQHAFLLF